MVRQEKKRNMALTISLVTLTGLAASYTGYWFVSSYLLRESISDWIMSQRNEGWDTSTGPVSISGFPFDMNVHFNRLTIQNPDGWGAFFPTLKTRVSPFWPYSLNVTLPSSYNVATPSTGWFSVNGPESQLQLNLGRRSRLEGVDLQAYNLTLNTPRDSYRVQHIALSGKDLGVSLNRSSRPTISFDASVRGLGLPALVNGQSGMSRTINAIDISGRVIGNIPNGPLDGALALWRDNSGKLELIRADLNWPPLRLTANGNLSLDRQMQPVGSGSGKAQNLQQTFDRMVESGLLSGKDVTMVKYGLGILNAQTKDDITLSMSIQDGQFYTGNAPLFKMPPVAWTDPNAEPAPMTPIVPATPTTPTTPDAPIGDAGPIVIAPQRR